MLARLTVRRFVFIEEATAEFEGGFCVLTGETGAGKSLLVDALSLLAGGRADHRMIMPGAESFEAEAAFAHNGEGAVADFLRQHDLLDDDGEMIVRRVVGKKNSRAFINGRQTPLSLLAEATAQAADICGQHHHYSMRRAAAHRPFLDSFANAISEADACAEAHRKWKDAADSLQQAKESEAEARRLRDSLSEQIAELDALDFSSDKWHEQNQMLSRLTNIADLSGGGGEARNLLAERVSPDLSQAARTLSALCKLDDKLAAPLKCVEEAALSADEAARSLGRYLDDLQTDPEAEREVESFVAAAHLLARKYQLADPADIGECAAAKKKELAALEKQADIATLEKRERAAFADLSSAAKALTKKRKAAAAVLEKKTTAALRQLAMPSASVRAQLSPLESPGAHGGERVEILIATRKDAPPGAVSDIASGGELSRLGLALQIAAGDRRQKPATVFDEVDAGIGGAAAASVGRFLRELGRTQQVLCVTHLAQVAAHADAHWRVLSADSPRGPMIEKLEDGGRVEELARIVGGKTVNAAARANAADLLKQSRRAGD